MLVHRAGEQATATFRLDVEPRPDGLGERPGRDILLDIEGDDGPAQRANTDRGDPGQRGYVVGPRPRGVDHHLRGVALARSIDCPAPAFERHCLDPRIGHDSPARLQQRVPVPFEQGMGIELAPVRVEQCADDPVSPGLEDRDQRLRFVNRQPFDRGPFAVAGLDPGEVRFLTLQRDEQRRVRPGAGLLQQRQAGGGQRADQRGVHVEMRKGGAAARSVDAVGRFRLAHHGAPVPGQPGGCGKTCDAGPDYEKIDLLHCASLAQFVVIRNRNAKLRLAGEAR